MTTPRPKKRDRTRSALLVAAQELLLEQTIGSISIRDVATRARVVQGTFYNYFETLEALLDGVGALFFAEHARLVATITEGVRDADDVFAVTTRQTLRFVTGVPGYGRILFDAGLPVDRFVYGLRGAMHHDVVRGRKEGRFHVDEPELAVAMAAGSLLGVALDLHRGALPVRAIERTTEALLRNLGVPSRRAERLAHAPRAFLAPPPLPLTGLPSAP